MNIVKKMRKKEFKEANRKLEDLVLKYQLINRSIGKYEKDIKVNKSKIEKEKLKKPDQKSAAKIAKFQGYIDYDKHKIEFLKKKLDDTKRGIKKWNEKRNLCK